MTIMVLIALLLQPSASGAVTEVASGVPAVGALVRVVAREQGSGWHIGIFNRLRVEPPCYRVVLLVPDGSNRIAKILTMREIEQMQVHRVYDGRGRSAPSGEEWRRLTEDWREVSVDPIRAINAKQCGRDG